MAESPLKVHHLKPAPGAHTKKTRVGRGEGSKGKSAGRGTKGTGARNQVSAGFEGGQLPLHMRLPKLRGFKNHFRVQYQVVNLSRLAELFPIWETRNGSRAKELNLPAFVYIETHGGIAIGGSDDHAGIDVGRTFTETPFARTAVDFLAHIRAGRVAAHGQQGSAPKWAHAAMALTTLAEKDTCQVVSGRHGARLSGHGRRPHCGGRGLAS